MAAAVCRCLLSAAAGTGREVSELTAEIDVAELQLNGVNAVRVMLGGWLQEAQLAAQASEERGDGVDGRDFRGIKRRR